MRHLADVLRDADPLGPAVNETRSAQARAVTRAAVLESPAHAAHDRRPVSRRRVLAAAGAAAAALVFAAVVWERASVDAVAAVRFEARIAGTTEAIIDNHDILTAEAVPADDGTFSVAITLTQEGGEKMRRATEARIGEHLELVTDGKVVMAPTIRGAVSTSAMLTGGYTRADAERVAEGLLKGRLEIGHER